MTSYRTASNDSNFTSMFPQTLLLIAVLIGMADASVKVTCPRDMDVVADRGSPSAVVTWTRDDFRLPSDIHIRGLYQTVPEYGAPANMSRSFPEGEHYIEYRAVDSTGRTGICSFTVNVRVIRCPVLSSPAFGVVRCDAGNYFGSMCTVDCQTGYFVAEDQSIECSRQSVWSGELPLCRVSTCEDPGTPLYGSRDCSSLAHAYGSRCSFTCRHGYRLHGSNDLTCVVNAAGSTTWSAATPSCQEIIPPFIEACPRGPIVHLTTSTSTDDSEVAIQIAKPHIVFRSNGATGPVTSHTCTHFADGQSDRFTIGRHIVTCTVLEDDVTGDDELSAPAQCQFVVDVQVDRCQPLNQPSSGFLMCSASSSLDDDVDSGSDDVTSCRLFCARGQTLPRPVDNQSTTYDQFKCDRRVGVWTPTNVVPSCVVPVRPEELKLPAELLYSATFDCSTASTSEDVAASLSLIRPQFQLAVQTRIAHLCLAPLPCIVADVRIHCHINSGANVEVDGIAAETSSTRRRRRRRIRSTRATTVAVLPTQPSSESSNLRRNNQRKHRKPRRRSSDYIPTVSGGSILSVQFHLLTRLSNEAAFGRWPKVFGRWPNEYHIAATQLRTAFDALERQLAIGDFRLLSIASSGSHGELFPELHEVPDSLSEAPLMTKCPSAYSFDQQTLLCVPCGPGSFYSYTEDRCISCATSNNRPAHSGCN